MSWLLLLSGWLMARLGREGGPVKEWRREYRACGYIAMGCALWTLVTGQ